MMDEQLIDEVAQHGVIYNRQKYYLNGSNGPGGGGGGKYETKDEAWQTIAIKLRTDVETCKKRWKYLRERYVSQRKQGDPPVYEHLSRPYLEKMKFLDQHIQPRKSYRNVPSFLTSPHSVNSSNYSEFNMDSKSNGSMKNLAHFGGSAVHSQHHYHQPDPQHVMNALSSATENGNGHVKIEADQVFRDFAAAVASQQLQQMSQSQLHHQQAAAVAAAMADSSQNYNEHFRDGNHMNGNGNGGVQQNGNGSAGMGIPSSSSSMKSPLSSPMDAVNGNSGANHSSAGGTHQAVTHSSSSTNHLSNHAYGEPNNDELDSPNASNGYHATKKPRIQLNSNGGSGSSHNNSNNHTPQHSQTGPHNNSSAVSGHYVDDTDDDSDATSNSLLQPQTILNENPTNNFDNVASTSSAAAAAAMQRNPSFNSNSSQQQQQQQHGGFPPNADFLFQLYQQLPHQQQQSQHNQSTTSHSQQQQQQSSHFNKFQAPQNPTLAPRSSEHLLGELVTTELLKMTKERRKHVQKRILEILFFDD